MFFTGMTSSSARDIQNSSHCAYYVQLSRQCQKIAFYICSWSGHVQWGVFTSTKKSWKSWFNYKLNTLKHSVHYLIPLQKERKNIRQSSVWRHPYVSMCCSCHGINVSHLQRNMLHFYNYHDQPHLHKIRYTTIHFTWVAWYTWRTKLPIHA
jgi:hypothetical protein